METAPHLQYVAGPLAKSVRDELSEGETDPFEIEEAGFAFAPKEHFVLAFDGERPLASAGWLAREIRVGDRDVAAAGLGGVLVRRTCRGRGLSRLVSTEGMARAARAGRTHGLLLCKPSVQPVWAHLGWDEVTDQVTYAEPDGERRTWPLVAMTRSLDEEPWPPGPVDLNGLPF